MSFVGGLHHSTPYRFGTAVTDAVDLPGRSHRGTDRQHRNHRTDHTSFSPGHNNSFALALSRLFVRIISRLGGPTCKNRVKLPVTGNKTSLARRVFDSFEPDYLTQPTISRVKPSLCLHPTVFIGPVPRTTAAAVRNLDFGLGI